MDGYLTVQEPCTTEIIEKKSRFICHAEAVQSAEDARAVIERIKMEHRLARHHVYAYVLSCGNEIRYSDDGEPHKTAGMPTLEVLQHANVKDCVLVTTRYFGGTLLGTGGLVRAYTLAAQTCLDQAKLAQMCACVDICLQVPYGAYDRICYELKQLDHECLSQEYGVDISLSIRMLAGTETSFLARAQDILLGADGIEVSEVHVAPYAPGTAATNQTKE